jgi:hypothetical protein
MSVACDCCVLPCRGLCDRPMNRPEESYRMRCVVVCDLENLINVEFLVHQGACHARKKPLQFTLIFM